MLLLQILNVLLGFSIFAFANFYSKQITTWTKKSFRWGLVIFEFHETFPIEIPDQLINNTVEIWDMSFKFTSKKWGLFKPIPRLKRRPSFPILLGEINLDGTGTAKITLRIPFSLIPLHISILIVVIYRVIVDHSTFNDPSFIIYQLIIVFVVFPAFEIILLLTQKERVRSTLKRLEKYITDGV
jgi:hypothetical protein